MKYCYDDNGEPQRYAGAVTSEMPTSTTASAMTASSATARLGSAYGFGAAGSGCYYSGRMRQSVPVVNNWWAPAIASWSGAMFPDRCGGFFAFGCLSIFLVIAYVAIVFAVYFAGVAAITIAFAFTAAWDLVTYSSRKRAVLR